ncbi:MAG: hypothetical protein A2V77_15770 [Anaeromyxobacter sp. RBG_16_69_14]|nr:MAG: hypothetical protein A2V77_15770 [Anaeromyxobacter sp. RBG_16_69_14]
MALIALVALASAGGAVTARKHEAGAPTPSSGPRRTAQTDAVEAPGLQSPCDQGPERVFWDYLGLESQDAPEKREAVRNERFRIALVTIADPVDSRLDSLFDQTVTGVALAAERLGYTLDRYWLPWQLDRRQRQADRSPDDCRTRQPGVILYRPHRPLGQALADAGDPSSMPLAFLLVGETPTAGIHPMALQRALELVDEAGDESSPVPVLGPTFSGTAPSLARELHRRAGRTFDVVTGSASSRKGLEALRQPRPVASSGTAAPALVRLRSTVHSTGKLWKAVRSYLCYLGIRPEQVAVLVESSTVYGASLRGDRRTDDPIPRTDLCAGLDSASSSPSGSRALPWEDGRMILRFPMHVSRIRDELDQKRPREKLVIGGYEVPVGLDLRADSQHDVKDVLPTFSGISENYEEQTLDAELASIRRHGIRAVGVMATDARDKTFLISKLRALVPDVLVFTFESSLLFVHPEVQRATYGSIVVSTYPLFVEAQSWTAAGPLRERVQFGGSAAEGVYNAALVALGSLGSNAAPTRLIDYDCPFPGVSPRLGQPPIWISVVGRDALWPIWIEGCGARVPRVCSDADDVACARPVVGVTPSVHPPTASRTMSIFAVLLALFAIGNAIAAFAARCAGLDLGRYTPVRGPAYRRQWGWLAVHLGWLATVVLAVAVVLSLPEAAGLVVVEGRSADSTHAVAGFAAAAAGVAFTATGWAGWGFARAREDNVEARAGALHVATRAAAALAIASAVAMVAVIWVTPALAGLALRRLGAAWTLLLFERMTNPASGVSPIVPLLFPALAIHLATQYQLVRVHLLDERAAGGSADGPLFRRFAGAQDPALAAADEAVARLVHGRLGLRNRALAVAFVIVPLAVVLCNPCWVPSPDGPGFDRLFRLLLGIVSVISGFSLWRAWQLWAALRRALERLPLDPVGAALQRLPALFRPERLKRLLWREPQLSDLEVSHRLFSAAYPPAACEVIRRRIERDLEAGRRGSSRRGWLHASLASLAEAAADAARGAREGARAEDVRGSAIEDFVASQLALRVFWVLAHLSRLLAFSVFGALSIMGAVGFYPFQTFRLLTLFIAILVLGAAGSAFVIYAQHDRDEVLSWMSATKPGRVSLDVSHVARFASLGAAPILALLAFEFPSFGHWIAAWVGPLFGAVK